MGIYVKTAADEWTLLGGGGAVGIGNWSTLSEVQGTYERKSYTHDDVEWVSYTFVDDGKFRLLDDGLIEMLLVASGSMESNNSGGKGGGVVQGIEHMSSGLQDVVIAKGGGSDIQASYVYESNGEVMFAGSVGGGWGSPANSGNGGADLSGNGVFSYLYDGTKIGYGGGALAGTNDPARDYGQGDPARANSGGASTRKSPSGSGTFGADGICIIRVPKGYADNVSENFYRWNTYATVEGGVVTDVKRLPDNEPQTLGGEWLTAPDGVKPGWDYVDGVFSAPTPTEMPSYDV
jgi:hypothetical protein